jgi:hypothetical protein
LYLIPTRGQAKDLAGLPGLPGLFGVWSRAGFTDPKRWIVYLVLECFLPPLDNFAAGGFSHSRESGNPEGKCWMPAFAGVTTLETPISPAESNFGVLPLHDGFTSIT